jgi:ABC-type sugar transport system substrate-binding protein
VTAPDVSQSPYEQGRLGMQRVMDVLDGKHVAAQTLLPTKVLTKGNVDSAAMKPYRYESSC